jgi:serine/threonine-protein kinase
MSEVLPRDHAYRLFAQALGLRDGVRENFLNQHCHSAALRREVEGLLNVATNDELQTSALRGAPAPEREAPLTGAVVGRFRLAELIGEGGMAVVYRAERVDGVKQSVAIKLLSTTLGAAAQRRFEREAQLLAKLEHPSIARLIDAGIEGARAWIAIEFVRGERIDQYCRSRNLPPRDIVRLLILLADAVAAAHRMLVVHSDIKPANVLITAEGLPKLVDFGISTALRDAGAQDSPTVSMGRLFSPNYAAPEQINGEPLTVSTDVFGLGALAYRLLAGCPPYADAHNPMAYLLAVTQRDVDTASRAAQAAGLDASTRRALRGDLDAILSKALERKPARRYATVTELQADFQRYLDERPVAARAPAAAYRAGKFLKRNAVVTALCALLLVSVLTGGFLAAAAARRADIARDMAARRGEFLESLLKSADPRTGRRDISIAELLDSATAALDGKLAREPLVEASMLGLIADTYDGLGRYAEGLAASDRQLALLHANGGGPLELGHALTSRGELLRELGKWDEATPVVRSAVSLLRGAQRPAELAAALDLLGIVLTHTHQEALGEASFMEEIAIESKGDQALRDRRSYAYFALEVMSMELGRYPQALNYGRQCLELARKSMPPDHQDLLAFEGQYGSTLISNHRAAEAEPILRDVVERETRVSGPHHKDTLIEKSVLADALLELHHESEAADVAHDAATGLESLLGAENSYPLSAWQTYGTAECANHQEELGLRVLHQVEAARRRSATDSDLKVSWAAAAVGSCLARMKRYAEAESVLLAAIANLESAHGEHYRRTQTTYASLRDLYADTGRPREATLFAAKLSP